METAKKKISAPSAGKRSSTLKKRTKKAGLDRRIQVKINPLEAVPPKQALDIIAP
jgi:hypothetical protein